MVLEKKIVILGGSYGGVSIAHYLLKHAVLQLPEEESYQVVLVSPSTQTMDRPACPRALISDDMFPQDKLFVGIPALFEQYRKGSFRFIHGRATALHHAGRTVSVTLAGDGDTATETIDYHALVIATGASTPSSLLGFTKDEKVLHECWASFRTALTSAKSILIAGGGPAGVETAGELGEHLNGRGSKSPNVAITIVTAGSKILPALRPALAKKAEIYLAKLGVTVIKGARVTTVAPADAGRESAVSSRATVTLGDGRMLEADLYIPAMGVRPNTDFVDASLLVPDGRVDTNKSTLRVDGAGPRVYAIGDASNYARPAVHNVLAAVPILGANIKRDLLLAAGKQGAEVGDDKVFKEDTRETQLVPIGKSKGGRDYWLWTTGGLWSGKQWAKEA
ncbi:FAD/NAD(P)-binding domain-containing protein [Pleurostoma richardsiae]|uniref:FAD/NAD(P)-binding domain-containing protein n=1 Tax=Pleurostoma richardsiae TaxID=41990 RepID=A0AA38RH52_9PEZI|nr:FAD/NAD(P)-binding domain-containing protein [Pleurostoma richardsiae]